jgi:exopolyphosphatase/guanosine-5'-triphosphate,3'-diphosphate pyrophosphatase
VLDLGSNSIKLQVLDAYRGAPPLPSFALGSPLRLSESLDQHGAVNAAGLRALVAAVSQAVDVAHEHVQVQSFARVSCRRVRHAQGP